MTMRKVQRITNPGVGPTACLTCGRGNVPDDPDTLDDFWAIDLGVDHNWGDPTHICKYCVETLLAEAGYVDAEELEALEVKYKARVKEIHNLRAQLESREKRLKVLTTAKAVIKDERKKAKAKAA